MMSPLVIVEHAEVGDDLVGRNDTHSTGSIRVMKIIEGHVPERETEIDDREGGQDRDRNLPTATPIAMISELSHHRPNAAGRRPSVMPAVSIVGWSSR